MSFPAYPDCKDSGVAWLGDLPSHWGVVQTKREFSRRKDLNTGMVCEDRLALTMNGVVPRSLDDLDGLQSSDFEGYQIFEAGDLAFKLIDLQNIKTSRVGLVPARGIMSPAYVRLEPSGEVTGRFGFWYFMALYWLQVFNNLGGGVRQTLGPEELLTVPFPLPTSDEQTTIAAFLDRETAKIDALVAEQERLIALLKEKRQAVISHAVTKGLNSDAPIKDSGIEWLGEIPAHWEVVPLKYLASIGNGSTPSKEDMRFWADGSFPWLNSSVVNMGVVDASDNFVTETALAECHLPIVSPPAILMAITGQGKTRGMVAPLAITATISQHVAFIKPNQARLDVGFTLRWLESQYLQIRSDSEGAGSTKGAITCDQISRFLVALPPLGEQADIARYLEVMAAEFQNLEAEAQIAINLLQERRAALISAAVTGKIDVRGAASQGNVVSIDKPQKSETGHSTQKPVECMKRPIQNNSKIGDAVYDPFMGSGTTIIAAEMTGRRAFGCELSPAYVDVIVRRWQDFTGKAATLEGDGHTFATIAELRAKA